MRMGKTCSKICSSIKGYLSGDRKETGIELKVQKYLEELDIAFEIQKPLLGITVADVFVFPNVAIFADGTYWHGSRAAEEKDYKNTKILEKNGYVVLRLNETEINSDSLATKEKLMIAYGKRKAKKEL